jgi:hypothetical protein
LFGLDNMSRRAQDICQFAKAQIYSEFMLCVGSEVEHFAVRLGSRLSGFYQMAIGQPDTHKANILMP